MKNWINKETTRSKLYTKINYMSYLENLYIMQNETSIYQGLKL